VLTRTGPRAKLDIFEIDHSQLGLTVENFFLARDDVSSSSQRIPSSHARGQGRAGQAYGGQSAADGP